MRAMREALGGRDRETLRRCAHSLAGSSANIGAGRLSHVARLLEDVAESGQADEWSAHMGAIERELQIVRSTLGLLLNEDDDDSVEGKREGAMNDAPSEGMEEAATVVALQALQEKLSRLDSCFRKLDPRASAAALQEILSLKLPEEVSGLLRQAGSLARRYQFKEAALITARILSDMRERAEATLRSPSL